MRRDQYEYRLIQLLDRTFDGNGNDNTREMANALALGIIALSLSQLVGAAEQLVDIGNVMADDLNNVAGTFVQSDLMDE